MADTTTDKPISRFVAITYSKYKELGDLPKSEESAYNLAKILQENHGFETISLPDLDPTALSLAAEEHLSENALPNGKLIISWTGHGQKNAQGSLSLMGQVGEHDMEVLSPQKLGEWAVRTGAQQTLILLDTCYSGSGLLDVLGMAKAVKDGRRSGGTTWFSVVAASRSTQKAREKALLSALQHLLAKGPERPSIGWERKRKYVRGADLVQTLLSNWNESRQTAQAISTGPSREFIHNPLNDQQIAEPVEQLLFAARGGSGTTSFFTGRESALCEIVTWLADDYPGMLVVTGPPGSGKSAVIGRIVSLSSPREREKLLAQETIPAQLDPGAESIDLHLHARGMTVELAAAELAHQLRLEDEAGLYGVLAEARRVKTKRPLKVVCDALDEAGSYSEKLAVELLEPLSHEALVIVGTREVTASGQNSLIELLGSLAKRVDLSDIPQGTTQQDVSRYIMRRLQGVDMQMEPAVVAEALVTEAAATAPFLLARLVTSQLREHPVNTSLVGWEKALATSVEDALEQDLQSVVLTIDGKPHPTAGRELMQALARAYGSGFPIDDVWPDVATAISASQTVYCREDAFAAMVAFGKHISTASSGGQPVYRIAHQRLVDYLLKDTDHLSGQNPYTVAISEVIFERYDLLLSDGLDPREHAYLWLNAWRHFADAGEPGLTRLEQIVAYNPQALLPDLAMAATYAADVALEQGASDLAITFSQKAVTIRRQLADPSKLAMALFSLSFVLATGGEDAAAAEAAMEASKQARSISQQSDRQGVLAYALFANALNQLRTAQMESASFLAEDAITLFESLYENDQDRWRAMLAESFNIASIALVTMGYYSDGIVLCERAIRIVRSGEEAVSLDIIGDLLSSLAAGRFLRAAYTEPGKDGQFLLADTSTGEELFSLYQKDYRFNLKSALNMSRGLQFLVRSRLLNAQRGLISFGNEDLVDALNTLNIAIDIVEPYIDQVADAAILYGTILSLRTSLSKNTISDEEKVAEQQIAEASLRRHADSNQLASFSLGSLLDSLNAEEITSPTVYSEQLIARQQEAVERLRGGTSNYTQDLLFGALCRLTSLYQFSGQAALSEDLRTEAIGVARSLVQHQPQYIPQLVGLLSDQAGFFLTRRTQEGVDMAQEALWWITQIEQKYDVLPIKLQTEGNLAAALVNLGRNDEASEAFKKIIEEYNPTVDEPPIISIIVANACLNLAFLKLNDGDANAALDLVKRAITLGVNKEENLPFTTNKFQLQIVLGAALLKSGEIEEGTQILETVIGSLTQEVRESNDTSSLALALVLAGDDFWEAVLTELSDRPDLVRCLVIQQRRPVSEMHKTVQVLLQALEESPSEEMRFIRSVARVQREIAPEAFDKAWQQQSNEKSVPGWLLIESAREWLFIAWWNTATWQISKQYLSEHPELLDESSDVLVEEFLLHSKNESLAKRHQTLLVQARSVGIEAAYAPLIADIEINDWIKSSNFKDHLIQHPELLEASTGAALQKRAQSGDLEAMACAGIVDLVNRGERQIAFLCVDDAPAALKFLQVAWRSNDALRLAALSGAILGFAEPQSMPHRQGLIGRAIAGILLGQAQKSEPAEQLNTELIEKLLTLALKDIEPDERQSLIMVVTEAIAAHPEYAVALAELITRLHV